jgi:hypothetical protein
MRVSAWKKIKYARWMREWSTHTKPHENKYVRGPSNNDDVRSSHKTAKTLDLFDGPLTTRGATKKKETIDGFRGVIMLDNGTTNRTPIAHNVAWSHSWQTIQRATTKKLLHHEILSQPEPQKWKKVRSFHVEFASLDDVTGVVRETFHSGTSRSRSGGVSSILSC